MNTTIILPALEEDECLKELLPELEGYEKVIASEVDLGQAVGRALIKVETEYVAVMDADGGHPAYYLPSMLRALETRDVDIVCGVRVRNTFSPQGVLSLYGSLLARLALRLPVSDCFSGFFMARTATIKNLPLFIWRGYGDYYIELLYQAHKKGLKAMPIPILYDPRIAGKSHTKLLKHSILYLLRIIECFLR